MNRRSVPHFVAAFVACSLPLGSLAQTAAPPRDWTTYGYDQQRTSWNQGETVLTKSNVSQLKLKWTSQLSTPPKDVVLQTLMSPLVVEGVTTPQGVKNLVVVLGADDTLFTIDADNGKILWQKTYPNSYTAQRPANTNCANTPNGTPVIDKQKGLVFFITSDGRLRALSLADGAERMTPTEFTVPFARTWSLNLIDDVLYTTSGRGCGEVMDPNSDAASVMALSRAANATGVPVDPGMISAMDVHDLAHPAATYFFTSSSRSNGAWGHGGVAKTPTGVITQTADGPYDPASGQFGSTVLELSPHVARLQDSFTPSNWKYVNAKDLDMGSGGLTTFAFGGKTVAASEGKEGVLYILDTASLGGADHMTPYFKSWQLGNDAALGTRPGQGLWGTMATYLTPDGRRFIYQPMWGPPSKTAPAFKNSNGPTPNGSIMAFELTLDGGKPTLVPAWSSTNMTIPDSPTVANGVVYATQTGEQSFQGVLGLPAGAPPPTVEQRTTFRATPTGNLILYAYDAETGKQLYSSKAIMKSWTHFTTPVVALGKVFVVTHDAKVYAFGL